MNLERYECGACPAFRRPGLGCEGGAFGKDGEPLWFTNTSFATDVCPRRHLIRNPDLVRLLDAHLARGDAALGLDRLDELTAAGVDAFALIQIARAEKRKEVSGD